MIYSVTGKLVHTEPELAVINCGGVGYACKTTLTTISAISGITGDVTLYTHLIIREDSADLYGFAGYDELHWFRQLITVSGVGAKAALTILSGMTVSALALAIASGDAKAFTKLKGIGTKTAQRIVIDLKSKVTNGNELLSVSASELQGVADAAAGGVASEAVAALISLGYSQSDAATAVAKQGSDKSVEQLIKGALRTLAGM
ncbi:MAG: Holliday junction branch migration protein RuvA [Oscillospiraceae bacterium]|nr:Holliday junction branch migration protein RuvA [Oscillospiraceae bacterium]